MKIELFFNTKNEITLRERFIEDINCCGGEGKIAREENTFAI